MIKIHYHEGGYNVSDENGEVIAADVKIEDGKIVLVLTDFEIRLISDKITNENPGG